MTGANSLEISVPRCHQQGVYQDLKSVGPTHNSVAIHPHYHHKGQKSQNVKHSGLPINRHMSTLLPLLYAWTVCWSYGLLLLINSLIMATWCLETCRSWHLIWSVLFDLFYCNLISAFCLFLKIRKVRKCMVCIILILLRPCFAEIYSH